MFKSQKNLIVRHKIHYFFSAALVIILICGTIKYLQVSAAIAQFADFAPPPESITSVKAKLAEWPKVKKAVGELVSIEGAKLSVQSSGRVLDITFEAGSFVNKGDVLVKLDTEKEQAALRAAVAENDRSRISYERLKNLLQKNAVSKDEVEIAQARYAETQALVARAEQDLRDKTVYAPISGYAGIRRVNIGQFVSPGENIVEINRNN